MCEKKYAISLARFLPRPPYSRVKRYSDVYKHPRKQLCAQKVPKHASFTIWRRKHRNSLNHMSHWHQVWKVPDDMINFDSHSFRFVTYITYPQQVLSFAFAFLPKRFLVRLNLKVKGTRVIFERIFIDQDLKKRCCCVRDWPYTGGEGWEKRHAQRVMRCQVCC